jgi:hypothetical protein
MLHLREFAYLAVTWTLLYAQPAAAQSPSKPPDAKTIAALIAQLGSENFQERQAATRSLEAIGRPALAALRKATVKHDDAEVRARAKGLVGKMENNLEQLLEDYRAYGLPVPTKDAPLVRCSGGVAYPGETQLFASGLGFLVKAGTKTELPVVLGGPHPYEFLGEPSVTILDPTKATDDEIESWITDAGPRGLGLAILCKARGWNSLAETFFNGRPKRREAPLPGATLRLDAWYYWQHELPNPRSDWPSAAPCLRLLLGTEPELNTTDNQALLRSLEAALLPSKATPGSIQAQIDALVRACSTNLSFFNKEPDRHYLRLVEAGFAAVPDLIKHLDDNRLTRIFVPHSHRPSEYQYRVRDVVGDLLNGLAEDALPRGWIRDLDMKSARVWWNDAKKAGEEAFLLGHVVPKDAKEPSDHLLRILLKRYPQHLPPIYRSILNERPEIASRSVLRAIALSELPWKQKMELFISGASHEMRGQRDAALETIKEQEPEHFVETVIKMLDQLPRTPKGSYWRCPEEQVVHLVLHADDKRVWNALEKAARRVDVGLRMQLLKRVATGGDTNQRRPARIAFLKSFLDDATLRDVDSDPDRFVAVPAGDGYPRLEVRNYAAMEIAELLKLKRTAQPTWDDKQWAQFRDEVRQTLKR